MAKSGEEFIARFLSRAVSPGGLALEYGAGGVDYSRFLPARLVRTDLTADRGRLEVCCDIQALPFRPGLFDLVFGIAVFVYVPDLEGAIAELARVLAPQGRLVMFEYVRMINAYNRHYKKRAGYVHTVGLGRLGRALNSAGLNWRRLDLGPEKGRLAPGFIARRRWLIVEAGRWS